MTEERKYAILILPQTILSARKASRHGPGQNRVWRKQFFSWTVLSKMQLFILERIDARWPTIVEFIFLQDRNRLARNCGQMLLRR